MTEERASAYYSRRFRRWVWLPIAVMGVPLATGVVWAWLTDPAAGSVLLGVSAALAGWVAAIWLRLGAYVHDDYLLVRNGLGHGRRLPWGDIESVELGPPARLTGYGQPFVRLRGEKKIQLGGTASSFLDPHCGDITIAGLQAELATRQQATPPPPASNPAPQPGPGSTRRSLLIAGGVAVPLVAVTAVAFILKIDGNRLADLFFAASLLISVAFYLWARRPASDQHD